MMWYGGSGVQWWGWLLMSVGTVAFWGLIVWAIWYLVASFTRQPERSQGSTDPKRILDERLARGEIDTEEYQRRLNALGGAPGIANGQAPVATGGPGGGQPGGGYPG